jgi:hypothetical protein
MNKQEEVIMSQDLRELTVEEVVEFTLMDLELLLETATEEMEPRVAPGTAVGVFC